MLKSEDLQSKKRSRLRTSTSCIECRRRKQKCNQAKDRPCNNCARRYPPVVCEYACASSKSKIRETVVELKTEVDKDPDSFAVETSNQYGTSNLLLDISPQDVYQARQTSPATSVSGLVHAGSPFPGGSSFQIPILGDHGSKSGSEYEEHNPDARSPYFPYPDDCQDSYYSIVTTFSSPIETLKSLPIQPTRRHAELMHLFIGRLAPYMSSIDGQDPVAGFNDEFLPFMIQSPIIAYIGILTASYYQAIAGGIDVENSVDAIATRFKLIKLINQHLSTHNKGVNDEAIGAVMSLAYNELIYADSKSVLAHMKGLREMLRTRGGVEGVSLSILRKLLFRTDYQVACTLECDPFLDDEYESHFIPTFVVYPAQLDSPLLQSHLRFSNSTSNLQISPETATILDDMRFLTTSVIAMTRREEFSSPQEQAKFLATATWIHKRVSAPIDPDLVGDFIYQSVRAVATVYSAAILSRTPLSQACTSHDLKKVWMNMWRTPLSRWKEIPGIFFWVVLCVSPFAKDKHEGRFFKAMFAVTTIAIGLVDWDVVMGMLRGFLAVQRWLKTGVLKGPEIRIDPPNETQRRKSTSAISSGDLPVSC